MLHVFIINPIAGKEDASESIRNFLSRKEDFNYLVFNSENECDEYNIAKRILSIFADDDIRFYICGGSGTFVNAFSAMEENDFKRTEFAHYAIGLTNDYIKNFGNCDKFFRDFDELIDGDVIKVDYGKIDDFESGLLTSKYMISLSVGYLDKVNLTARKLSFFNKLNPVFIYSFSCFLNLFTCKKVNYRILIDDEDYSGQYMAIYIGNGVCLGGHYYPFKSAYAGDGYQEVLLLKPCGLFDFVKYLMWFKNGQIEYENDAKIIMRKARKVYMERVDGKEISLNIDGECGRVFKLNAEIFRNSLKYVVPKGFRLYTCRDIVRNKEKSFGGKYE